MNPDKSPRPTFVRISYERIVAFIAAFSVLAFGLCRAAERLSVTQDRAHVSGFVALAAVWVALALITSD